MRRVCKRVAPAVGVLGVLAPIPAAPAEAVPNTQCTLTTPVQEVQSTSQLPAELLQLLPRIAEIGAPFNKTDAVNHPTLPFRRLIRAGSRGTDWFLWYEHGGFDYFWQAVIARVTPGEEAKVLANAGTVSDTLCTFTDGVFAGKVPPYPQGTWAAAGF
ncbi:hypothetical protein [Mycobacterium intermedium]|uniref:hypothetical protein n=1 Tax=Mycobacterium intermedium TaxID=28445 RepID=UPI001E5289B7|nr:hypothetical protein [Mycobacterium intermedium]